MRITNPQPLELAELETIEDRLYDARPAPRAHRAELDRWQTDPRDRDYLEPAARWCRVCTLHPSDPIHERLAA